jgi:hypothetical protein
VWRIQNYSYQIDNRSALRLIKKAAVDDMRKYVDVIYIIMLESEKNLNM